LEAILFSKLEKLNHPKYPEYPISVHIIILILKNINSLRMYVVFFENND